MGERYKGYFISPTKHQIETNYKKQKKDEIRVNNLPNLVETLIALEQRWSKNRNYFNDKYLLINFKPITKLFQNSNKPSKKFVDRGNTLDLYLDKKSCICKKLTTHFFEITKNISQKSKTRKFSFSLTYYSKDKNSLILKLLRPTDIIRAGKMRTLLKNSNVKFEILPYFYKEEQNPRVFVKLPRMEQKGHYLLTYKNLPLYENKGYLDLINIEIGADSANATNKRGLFELRNSFFPQQILALNLAAEKLKQKYDSNYLKKLFSIPKVSQKLVHYFDILRNHTILRYNKWGNEIEVGTNNWVDIDYFLMQIMFNHFSKNNTSILESPNIKENLTFELQYYKRINSKNTIYGFYDCKDYHHPNKKEILRP